MIRNKSNHTQIVVDLTGPQGNAFYLISLAMKLAKKLGYTSEEIYELVNDMKSSDYDHLVNTFDFHFGTFVILEK